MDLHFIALFQSTDHSKHFATLVTLIHSHTHSHTDGGGCLQSANRSLGAIWGSQSSFIDVPVSSYLDTLCDIKSWPQVSWLHWFSVTYKIYSQFSGIGLIPTPSFFQLFKYGSFQWPSASNNVAVPTTLVLQVKGSTVKLVTICYMQQLQNKACWHSCSYILRLLDCC